MFCWSAITQLKGEKVMPAKRSMASAAVPARKILKKASRLTAAVPGYFLMERASARWWPSSVDSPSSVPWSVEATRKVMGVPFFGRMISSRTSSGTHRSPRRTWPPRSSSTKWSHRSMAP